MSFVLIVPNDIKYMIHLRHRVGEAYCSLLCACYVRRFVWGKRDPTISFTFDDFPRTAYNVGGAILRSFGARATYYASVGLMNTTNEVGELFYPGDLHDLLEDGHELGSHTFSHMSCRYARRSVFHKDARMGRTAIEKITGQAGCGNFSYPFGHVSLVSKKMLGPEMASCRSIFPGVNGPYVDLNALKANKLYGDLSASWQARQLIVEAKTQRGWLIFYSHDVCAKPSAYGCTPSLLESVVSFALSHGCRVMTVGEVLGEVNVKVV